VRGASFHRLADQQASTRKFDLLVILSYPLADLRDYEEDHLVPLCLAGAPQDPANLWPQPRFGEWSANRKDTLETKLCRLVCDGRVPLAEAQREIATDWIAAYRKYIGAGSRKSASHKVPFGP